MTTTLGVVQSSTLYPFAAYGRYQVMWGNVIGKPDVVDNALDIPDGPLVFVEQTPKTRIFTVRMTMVSASETALNDSLAQLAGLIWDPANPILMRRSIPIAAGTQTADAYCMYLGGLDPGEKPAPHIALLALQFRMLSAYWYDTTSSLAVAL